MLFEIDFLKLNETCYGQWLFKTYMLWASNFGSNCPKSLKNIFEN